MIKFKHLRSRIAFTFIGVMVAMQLAALIPLKYALDRHASQLAGQQINAGERGFVNQLQHNTQNLKQAAQLLVGEEAFRDAIHSRDTDIIQSVLATCQTRMRAQIAYYLGTDDGLVVTGRYDNTDISQAIIQKILQNPGGTLKFDIVDGKPYQLIAVPVNDMDAAGWLVMGFVMDDRLTTQLKQLTGLDVTILQKIPQHDWQLVSSTVSSQLANILMKTVADVYSQHLSLQKVDLAGQAYQLKIRTLHERQDQALLVVLQASVTPLMQALQRWFQGMLVLAGIGVLLFVVLAWYVSRQTTRPLAALTGHVNDIALGDYEKEIAVDSSDEVGYLGKALDNMRAAVLQRSLDVQQLVFKDALTGLANRLALMQALQQAITQHADEQEKFSLLVLNIHRFKQVNNMLGRKLGDDLLRHVGQVLQDNALSAQTMVARLDADEFAVLLPQADQARATSYAENIQRIFEGPVQVQEQTMEIPVAMGIALYPEHEVHAEALLSHAETALYEAKSKQVAWIVYNTALELDQAETLALIADLKQAIQQNQLLLYIQPRIDLTTRKTLGAEALIRWVHPEKGMLLPDQFIPFAEQTGLICEMTDWVLRRACEILATLRQRGLRISLSVNLSARDLNNMALPDQIAALLTEHALDAAALSLEITESSWMQAAGQATTVIRKLAEMGVQLAIDDFGIGHSSLAYLKQLPVQTLKIDRSFVMYMDKHADHASIVKASIELAHTFGLNVVAEGIENEEVLARLTRLGCDEGQGYFIGKPMPEKDFSIWLERWEGQSEIDIDIGDDLSFAANPLDDFT